MSYIKPLFRLFWALKSILSASKKPIWSFIGYFKFLGCVFELLSLLKASLEVWSQFSAVKNFSTSFIGLQDVSFVLWSLFLSLRGLSELWTRLRSQSRLFLNFRVHFQLLDLLFEQWSPFLVAQKPFLNYGAPFLSSRGLFSAINLCFKTKHTQNSLQIPKTSKKCIIQQKKQHTSLPSLNPIETYRVPALLSPNVIPNRRPTEGGMRSVRRNICYHGLCICFHIWKAFDQHFNYCRQFRRLITTNKHRPSSLVNYMGRTVSLLMSS